MWAPSCAGAGVGGGAHATRRARVAASCARPASQARLFRVARPWLKRGTSSALAKRAVSRRVSRGRGCRVLGARRVMCRDVQTIYGSAGDHSSLAGGPAPPWRGRRRVSNPGGTEAHPQLLPGRVVDFKPGPRSSRGTDGRVLRPSRRPGAAACNDPARGERGLFRNTAAAGRGRGRPSRPRRSPAGPPAPEDSSGVAGLSGLVRRRGLVRAAGTRGGDGTRRRGCMATRGTSAAIPPCPRRCNR